MFHFFQNCYYFFSNIDTRIRQAELEYAYGREELLLLTIEEKIRALQFYIEKDLRTEDEKNEKSLYFQIHKKGLNLCLCAVDANFGQFGISAGEDGIYIDWVFEGTPLYRGDRILEFNGNLIDSKSIEGIQKLLNTNGKCELVVIRTRFSQQKSQMLLQSQEDNLRLQHRISYLEDQVKELQKSTKIIVAAPEKNIVPKPPSNKRGDHVTSINISSSSTPKHHENEPQIFQRGDFVATIIGGKAIQTSSHHLATLTETLVTAKNSRNSANYPADKLNGYVKSDSEHDTCLRNRNTLLTSQQKKCYSPQSTTKQREKNIRIRGYLSDMHNPLSESHDCVSFFYIFN